MILPSTLKIRTGFCWFYNICISTAHHPGWSGISINTTGSIVFRKFFSPTNNAANTPGKTRKSNINNTCKYGRYGRLWQPFSGPLDIGVFVYWSYLEWQMRVEFVHWGPKCLGWQAILLSKIAPAEVGVWLPWWCHALVLPAPGNWELLLNLIIFS